MSENDYGIKPDWREALRIAREFPTPSHLGNLCDLSDYLLAKLMESEFRRELRHAVCINCDDPRHDYKYDDWLRVAREALSERRDDE